jgi:hypothetical protein
MFVIWRRLADAGYLGCRSFLAHFVLYVQLLLTSGFSMPALGAQTIAIKIADGRNGHPISSTCVNVWVGNDRKKATAIPTDGNGIATLRLTEQSNEVDTRHQWNSCGLFGVIDPVLKYHDDIRINVGYVLCQANSGKNSWLSTNVYRTKDLLKMGIVSPNTCGKTTAERRPGELTIFVRPLSWWEKFKQ